MVTKSDVKIFEKRQRPLQFPPKNPKLIMESCKRDFSPSNVEELITKWRFISEDASVALDTILEVCEPLLENATEYTKNKIPELLRERLFPSLPAETINSLRSGKYPLEENAAQLSTQLQESAQYIYDCSRIIANRDKIRKKCDFTDFISTNKTVYQMSERIYTEYANVNPRNVYSIILENIRLETELDPDTILAEVTEFFKSNELLSDIDITKVKEKTCMYENLDILDKYTKCQSVNEYVIGKQDLINHIDELKRNDSMNTSDIKTVTDKLLYSPINEIIHDVTTYLQFIKKYFVYNQKIDMDAIKLCISKLIDRLKANMIDSDVSNLIADITNEQKAASKEISSTTDAQKKTRTIDYINLLGTLVVELEHVNDFVDDYESVVKEFSTLEDEENMAIVLLSEKVVEEVVETERSIQEALLFKKKELKPYENTVNIKEFKTKYLPEIIKAANNIIQYVNSSPISKKDHIKVYTVEEIVADLKEYEDVKVTKDRDMFGGPKRVTTHIMSIDECFSDDEDLVDKEFRAFFKFADELQDKIKGKVPDYIVIDTDSDNIFMTSKIRIDTRKTLNEAVDNRGIEHPDGDGASEETDPETKQQILKVASSVKNFSKLAAMNVSSAAKNASTAEKKISKTIDNTVSDIEYDIKNAIHNNSREKVIKGKLIPSASRAIKLAIAGGAGMAINPALTIIVALGTLGVSKKISKKERQYILDEIDIELKILDKKIQHAEMTNDTEELSNLLRLQRTLQRERQRIKYKMKNLYIPASYSRRD